MDSLDAKVISVRDNLETLSRINHYLEVYTLTTDQFLQKFSDLKVNDIEQDVLREARQFLIDNDGWSIDKVKALMSIL